MAIRPPWKSAEYFGTILAVLPPLSRRRLLRGLAPARSEEDFLLAIIMHVDYNAHVFQQGYTHG